MEEEDVVKLVVFGESTVQGGPWLDRTEQRYADLLAGMLRACLDAEIAYHNAGLSASVIAPASPGYEASAKPSAAERLDAEVIAHRPDVLVIAYGLNDMRAGMEIGLFGRELRALVDRVRARCSPLVVLATVYHMTAWRSYPPFDKGSPEAIRTYNALIRLVAAEKGCACADIWTAMGERDWLVHHDGVHANVVGNLVIAGELFATIARAMPGLADDVLRRHAATEWTRTTAEWRRSGGPPPPAR